MPRSTKVALSAALLLFALSATVFSQQTGGPPGMNPGADRKFGDFNEITKGAKEHEGFLRLFHKDETVYAEILPPQFERPILCSTAIAKGVGMGGHTLNFDEQWVLYFKRVGDKVQLVRRNVRFQAKKGSAVSKAVDVSYSDSVLMALKIHAINPQRQGVLINLNDIFMTDFAQLGLGFFDPSRSTWGNVKTFPKNVELQVNATFGGGGRGGRGDPSVIDGRGLSVVIHYGLVQLPEDGYQPRFADDRVGHFLTAVKDFTTDDRDTSFLRYINRWRLERADTDPKHADKLSAPKKKIVFWIEKSVPEEYRAAVREGILEWNKAFEKVGFRDAIEVRQQEGEDFDPEDINYNTFRWIASDRGFAMGPSRANPLTGEILDADIIFDASMVRYWKREHQLMTTPPDDKKLAVIDGEPVSFIKASKLGWGLEDPLAKLRQDNGLSWDDRKKGDPRLWAIQHGACQCGPCMSQELSLAALMMETNGIIQPGERVPDELIQQAIKEVTMHEVGHTLGLRHNFKASTMLPNDKLHDTTITRKQGLTGSVMDYAPINLAPKGQKQGDYFSTTIGPYDYWAIEYAYKPLSGGTDGEYDKLSEIANRGGTPGHDYATDEDMYFAADPLVHVWDLGADPMKYAQDRLLLSEELLKTLADRVVDKGEGYQRLRSAFGMLMRQYGDGAALVSEFVGGEHMHRDHKADPNGRDPFVPVKAQKQREALKFLQEHILTDRPFQFSPALLRRLAAERWSHWGTNTFGTSVEYPVHENVLGVQRIVLNHVFSPDTLRRIQNNALKTDKDEKPLEVAEVFRSLTDGIWSELPNGGAKDGKKTVTMTIVRRNLQREHLHDLAALVVSGGGAPADAKSLARMHLREINKRIEGALGNKELTVDDTTRAHLEECQERITKVLAASIQAREP